MSPPPLHPQPGGDGDDGDDDDDNVPIAHRIRRTRASQPPPDIRTGTSPQASQHIAPLGAPAAGLRPAARALLAQLVALYLDRLPAELAAGEAARLDRSDVHFAWEGPLTPGARHYYRVQGDDLLIEYDTTADGNHAHTVLRRPRGDFGDDVLAAHYARRHP